METESELVLFDLREIAQRTSTSVAFWRRQVRKRAIRVFRIGDTIRISQGDLSAWLSEHAQPAEVRE